MRIWLALTMLAAAGLGSVRPLHAQTVVGTWQAAAVGGQREVTRIARAKDGRIHGEAYYLDQETGGARNGNPISKIEIEGRHVRFAFDERDVTFEGELSADGRELAGLSTSAGQSTPLTYERATAKTRWPVDPSPHKVLFVPVQKNVRLEVLDWGGRGPPLILLAGNRNTAHVFDDFALRFTGRRHVYGITRRGFGLSGRPAPTQDNYDPDRLGDDVLAVIDALKLDRPVIAGHSLAGEEMSSIGTRHPERVSGLIYLEAGYEYAFYDPKADNVQVDTSTIRRDLAQLLLATPSRQKFLIQEIQATLPSLQRELQTLQKKADGAPDGPSASRRMQRDQIEEAVFTNMRKYPAVKAPALAIFASPHACAANCDTPEAKAGDLAVAVQADAFEAGGPQVRVVRIANANHYVFRSDEAEVVKEMNAFMDGLH